MGKLGLGPFNVPQRQRTQIDPAVLANIIASPAVAREKARADIFGSIARLPQQIIESKEKYRQLERARKLEPLQEESLQQELELQKQKVKFEQARVAKIEEETKRIAKFQSDIEKQNKKVLQDMLDGINKTISSSSFLFLDLEGQEKIKSQRDIIQNELFKKIGLKEKSKLPTNKSIEDIKTMLRKKI